MAIFIGTSGWSYDHWQDVLYPPGLPPSQRLAHYFNEFSTVELNSSFYRWPRNRAFQQWKVRLPPGFLMSVKAPRGLTHGKKLYSPEVWVSRLASCWHELGDKRGVMLVQLPPQLSCDHARLRYFLQCLPRWMRIAVEFRHPSWNREETYHLLEEYQAAYCIMSGADLPCVLRATSSFVYVRLHGPDHNWLYGGHYSDQDLHWWADRIREWNQQQKDIFVYFNNDGGGNAVKNARYLVSLIG